MEAPEKLYLHPTAKGNVGASWLTFPLTNEDIEYIRKDSFIEKSMDYIAKNMRCDGYTLQTKAKFIRDFKKYMEE